MTTYGPTLIHRCSACDTEFKEPGIASGNTAHAVFRSDGKLDAPMLPVTPPLIACPSCRGVMTLYGRTPYAQFEPEWQVDNVLSDRAPGQFTDLQDLDKDKPAEKHADVPKFATPTVEECLSYLSSTSYSSEYEVAFRSYTVQRVNDQRLLRASDSVLASLEAPAASSTSNEGIKIISTRLLETFGTGRKSDTPTCENLKTLVSRGAQCAPLDQGQAANHIALLSLLDEIEDEFSVLTRAELLRELGRFTDPWSYWIESLKLGRLQNRFGSLVTLVAAIRSC